MHGGDLGKQEACGRFLILDGSLECIPGHLHPNRSLDNAAAGKVPGHHNPTVSSYQQALTLNTIVFSPRRWPGTKLTLFQGTRLRRTSWCRSATTRQANSGSSSTTTQTSSHATQTATGQEICHRFNYGNCSRANCNFAHKCWTTVCGEDHLGKSCPRTSTPPDERQICTPHSEFDRVVTTELEKEGAAGRVLGPFAKIPMASFRSSRLSAIPKKNNFRAA